MKKKYETVQPSYLKNSRHFLKDILMVVQKTDGENWAFFGEENATDFTLNFIKHGDLSRLIYVDEVPAAYVECFLIKSSNLTLLQDDYYHTLGLSSADFKESYSSNQADYSNYSLYVNVVAVVREYQNSIRMLRELISAIQDILFNNFVKRPEFISAVAVSKEGEKMCESLGFQKISESQRRYRDKINNRKFYCGKTLEVMQRLERFEKNCGL
ncbi:hypothetical protein [uncultured Enterococcus sp.]|uniref:hypothetical protein n=1 Tax=uncultured Enterococcus sp. TaxID=167972 RepID=UPI002AA86219|nr:hypothetical protein [uncultured Enterococcus sp.]